MDSRSGLSDEAGDAERDEARRVEELLRVNARLAAEVRSLALGRTEAPRPGAMPAPRRIGALSEERDRLRAECDRLRAELESTTGQLRDLGEHSAALERDRDALAAEVQRLRVGWSGLARRTRARLLGR